MVVILFCVLFNISQVGLFCYLVYMVVTGDKKYPDADFQTHILLPVIRDVPVLFAHLRRFQLVNLPGKLELGS